MKVFCVCLSITVTVMFTGRRITTLKRHCLNSCLLSIGGSNLCSNWKFIHWCYITWTDPTVIYGGWHQWWLNQFGTWLVLAKDDQQQQPYAVFHWARKGGNYQTGKLDSTTFHYRSRFMSHLRDPIHNGPTEKCNLININTWINVTSNNILDEQIISRCSLAGFKRNLDRHLRDERGYIYKL